MPEPGSWPKHDTKVKLPGTPIDRIFWCLWIFQFAILEYLGVTQKRGYTSLTRLTLATIPRWMLAMFLGWLTYHFLIQYR